jgi:hypothetical protein
MTFDQYGHLTPYEIIETDLNTFQKTFVTDFTASTTRPQIFEAYLEYLHQLRQIVGDGGFYQWIDGSFVTQKSDPKDIDFVTFVDWQIYEKYETPFNELRKLRLGKTKIVDGYFVKVYNETHPQRTLFEMDCAEWLFDFGRTFINKRYKGIIKINY